MHQELIHVVTKPASWDWLKEVGVLAYIPHSWPCALNLLTDLLHRNKVSLCHTLKHSATCDVQDAELHGGRGNISIRCVFASGSKARGCHVEIRNSSIDKLTTFLMNVTRSGNPLSHTAEQTVTGLIPGSYEVFIFDWERDGSVASTPSYVGHANISEPVTVNTSTTPTVGKTTQVGK